MNNEPNTEEKRETALAADFLPQPRDLIRSLVSCLSASEHTCRGCIFCNADAGYDCERELLVIAHRWLDREEAEHAQ